jgi:hypothetical protein
VDALVDREWPATIQAKIDSLVLQDKEYRGGDESDSDEGEDSDESDDEEDEVFLKEVSDSVMSVRTRKMTK